MSTFTLQRMEAVVAGSDRLNEMRRAIKAFADIFEKVLEEQLEVVAPLTGIADVLKHDESLVRVFLPKGRGWPQVFMDGKRVMLFGGGRNWRLRQEDIPHKFVERVYYALPSLASQALDKLSKKSREEVEQKLISFENLAEA